MLDIKDVPLAFLEGRNLNIMQYYDLVYKKLKDRADGQLKDKEPFNHPLCIQNLRFI